MWVKKLKIPAVTAEFFVLLCAIVMRFAYYGFKYFPQLDDYIQYHNYANFEGGLSGAIKNLGLLAARPLAGVFDVGVWSNFWGNMFVPIVIISILFAVTALLLWRIFRRHFGTSPLFMFLLVLMPTGFEGTYWISASSRVVVGLFFAALAAYLFDKYAEKGGAWALVVSFVAQLVSFGFYEQVIVWSITITFLLAFLNMRVLKKRVLWSLVTFLNCGLFFTFTKIFADSALYAGRLSIALPGSIHELLGILSQCKEVFVDSLVMIFTNGLVRGAEIIWQDKAFVFVGILVIVCIFVYKFQKRDNAPKQKLWIGLLVAFLLVIAPITPFFVLPNPWIGLRNAVCSFVGMALFFGIIFTYVLRNKKAQSVVGTVICALFIVCGVSEIHDYRQTYFDDTRVIMAVADIAEDSGKNIAVIGIEPSFLTEQNFAYHEHIHGVTDSNWALTGAVNAKLGHKNEATIMPISVKNPYHEWDKEQKQLRDFDSVYYYKDGTVTYLLAENTGGDNYDLYMGDKLFASLNDEDNLGVFTIYD